MLNGDMSHINCFGDDEALLDWEKKLIEWCFEFPENNICGTYFNAIMNKPIRRCLRGGL